MQRTCLFLCLLVACGMQPPESPDSLVAFQTSSLAATCDVPLAVADDGLDDRQAIQDALDAQGCVYLPPGTYDIDSIPFTPPARRPYMMLSLEGELYGDGPRSVLAFRGSAQAQDWEGIRATGAGLRIHDLTLRTRLTETREQTHVIKVLGPSTDIEISRITFDHPRAIPGEKAGDCIQFVAYADGREIVGAKIHDNDFAVCDRSGIAVHSGTTFLEITDNQFSDIGNTDLDFEGTGDTSHVLIANNRMDLIPGSHGIGSLQLQRVDNVRVTGNVFNGRGIDVNMCNAVEIDHNIISLSMSTTVPVITIGFESSGVNFHHNTITRTSTAQAGVVIAAGPQTNLTLADNAITQETSSHVVNASGVVGIFARHNRISYTGSAAGMFGLQALGSAGLDGIRTTDVHVESNTFTGPLKACVSTSGSYSGAGTFDTSDNASTGPLFGLWCNNFSSQGTIQGPFTAKRNAWASTLCGPSGFVQ